MSKVTCDISISLDGYVAGPEPTLEEPLGRGGELLHRWVTKLAGWRSAHGLEGGETGPDDELVAESISRQGALLMGRRMFSGGEGPWEDDPRANGWWGDDPPFRAPVFVLTHHPRGPLTLGRSSFTFVTDGFDAALARAREAAGDRDVAVAGGASVVQQALAGGMLDELELHVAPVLLGGGTRLFADGGRTPGVLELVRVVDAPDATHLRYRVVR